MGNPSQWSCPETIGAGVVPQAWKGPAAAKYAIGYRQGSFANLPMSRWGHRRYRPTSCPPSLRAAIRLGNACGLTRFRLCISPGGHQHQRGFPVGERADDAGSAVDLPVRPLDGVHDVLGDASHELPQVHRPVLGPRHRRLLPHAFC